VRGRRLRVGLLSPWASRLGGGVFEAVVSQAATLRAAGAEPVVFALEDAHSAADRYRFGDTTLHLGRVRGPAQIGYSFDLGRKLVDAELDVLHLHGIWMATSHLAARWAAATDRPYVISPHGMLDPWITAHGRAKKLAARIGYERRSWRRATLFHALTAAEAADIRRETGREAIEIIPNAVDIGLADRDGNARELPARIAYLGRIHRKKNIDALIDAWQLLARRRGDTAPALTIAGWGDAADVAALRQRIDAIADQRLSFVGPVYGEAKRRLIEGATALALPSHSEGLPMVVLESWAAGVPTAISRHCNLPEGFATGAAEDCGTEADPIAHALAVLIDESEEARQRRRAAARELVARRFSPTVVLDRWMETYERQRSERRP